MFQAFADIVAKCLAKRPEDRFTDMGDLIAALKPYADGTRFELIDLGAEDLEELRKSEVELRRMRRADVRHAHAPETMDPSDVALNEFVDEQASKVRNRILQLSKTTVPKN